jgi:predicted acylesterase/phospholipase RssA
MRAGLLARTAALASAVLLAACGSFPQNPRLAAYDPESGYRFERLDEGNNGDELFVVLAFSGGGTRAAALSYGVLEALRDTSIEWHGRTISLLDEVDVISSISGGSFTAAYYGLRGDKAFEDFPERVLYRPIQSDLIRRSLAPSSLLKLAGSSFGRSDLAAEFYDQEIFDAATYAQLVAQRRRPFVILNATDMTLGAQFSFIQDQFDLLCSDLSGVTLGRAVASSSAFPGGLTPLTFQNYAGTCGYRQPPWVDLAIEDHQSRINARRTVRAEQRLSYTESNPARPFIHLTDGGVADNIGLREPLTAITGTNNSWSVLRLINRKKVNTLVVIVVNAATDPANRRDLTPSVPGPFDTVMAAATVPLDNYTFDTLEILRATVETYNKERQYVADCQALAAAKGAQCALDIPVAHPVEFFPIEVAFSYIGSTEEREWFKNLPTSLELPRATVDKLRAVGRRLLGEDPQFKELLKSVQGCSADTTATADCAGGGRNR